MAKRIRVLLLIPHLGGGGAEQVTALLAGGLSREKYEVHLGLVTQTADEIENLPPWVAVHALGARRVRAGAIGLIRLVLRLRPRVILSGMAHLNFLVLLLRPLFPAGTRVLARQNGTVSTALASGELPGYTGMLYRLLYYRADRVICQTHAMAADLAREARIPRERLAVLANPVDVNDIRSAAAECSDAWSGPGPHLLAVGRLAKVKGFDLLLRALVNVREQFPTADLVIAGAGPEEAALKALANESGIRDAVRFVGQVDRPWVYFSGASLFVLSSRHEGLPNAMLEAAAGGLPLVATPASEGIVELLRGQPGVWLAEKTTVEALTNAILTALHALRPGERFPHLFVAQFSLNNSIQAYEQLIDAVVEEHRP